MQTVFRIGILGAVLVAAINVPAQAQTDPCAGIRFQGGEIILGNAIPLELPLQDSHKDCLAAISKELLKRPYIRSLTVAVRLPDEERQSRKGIEVANAIAKHLVEAGASKQLVSAVAPVLGHGQTAGVSFAYRERRRNRVVAELRGLFGSARTGWELGDLRPAVIGDRLVVSDYFETGEFSYALLKLADESILYLGPSSLVRLGSVEMTAELKRRVVIELSRGEVETIVVKDAVGSVFQIITQTAIAGVRGTTFRTVVEPSGSTRLETTGGQVELAGAKGSIAVGAGFGSRVSQNGIPEPARALLTSPVVEGPRLGSFQQAPTLRWQPVSGATQYRIELARNAEFSSGYARYTATVATLNGTGGLSPGKWFWRVLAIDADGFVGMPSKIYAFETDN